MGMLAVLDVGIIHAPPPTHTHRVLTKQACVLVPFLLQVTPDQRVALVEFITHLTMEDWSGVAADLVTLGFMPDGLPQGDGAQVGACSNRVHVGSTRAYVGYEGGVVLGGMLACMPLPPNAPAPHSPSLSFNNPEQERMGELPPPPQCTNIPLPSHVLPQPCAGEDG